LDFSRGGAANGRRVSASTFKFPLRFGGTTGAMKRRRSGFIPAAPSFTGVF
jgi:hypothetical protein